MNIFRLTTITPNYFKTGMNANYNFYSKDNKIDTFEYTNSPAFTSSKKLESKRIEETLRNIDGIHDPYSDVVMISEKKFKLLKNKISKRHNSRSMINLLSGYQEHMFEPEKEVFNILKKTTQDAYRAERKGLKELDFHSILQEMLPEAKLRLVKGQLDVIDDMKELSYKTLSESSRKKVNKVLNNLEEDVYSDEFRIRPSMNQLAKLKKQIPEKDEFDDIFMLTERFPSSINSKDVFIVKYADLTSEEIAEKLIKPALISVEHIKPASKHGESSGKNYIAASTRMNSLRSSMPLEDFIRRFPKIPEYTQRYADELITKVNRGGLRQLGGCMPDVKESLYIQSNGLIDIDIDALNPSIYNSIQNYKEKLDELMEHFADMNK